MLGAHMFVVVVVVVVVIIIIVVIVLIVIIIPQLCTEVMCFESNFSVLFFRLKMGMISKASIHCADSKN
jgi:hypothetical protein